MKEVMKLNHNLDPNSLQAGQTIMLPLGKLSERDRQILDGMKAGNYRTYPIRAGEKLSDVLANRKISMDEFQLLNPELNPNKVKGVVLQTLGPCVLQ
jgi:LysM domain